MIAPKYMTISLTVAFAYSAAVSAFTTPRTTSIIPKSINPVVVIHPGAQAPSTPLHLLKKDMAVTEAEPSSKVMATNPDAADIDNGKNDLIAPTIYASYLIYGIFDLHHLSTS